MNINDDVYIRCRGNSIFRVLFVGKELIVVADGDGKEFCVDIDNVIEREESN